MKQQYLLQSMLGFISMISFQASAIDLSSSNLGSALDPYLTPEDQFRRGFDLNDYFPAEPIKISGDVSLLVVRGDWDDCDYDGGHDFELEFEMFDNTPIGQPDSGWLLIMDSESNWYEVDVRCVNVTGLHKVSGAAQGYTPFSQAYVVGPVVASSVPSFPLYKDSLSLPLYNDFFSNPKENNWLVAQITDWEAPLPFGTWDSACGREFSEPLELEDSIRFRYDLKFFVDKETALSLCQSASTRSFSDGLVTSGVLQIDE